MLSFFILLFAGLAIGEFRGWYSLKKGLLERGEEINRTAKNIELVRQEIEQVNDPAFLEKEARAKLNLKREGEEVFVVIGLENIETPENFENVFAGEVESQNEIWLNIKSWWRYFFQK